MALYEGFIDLPKDSIKTPSGFSMDIGGSLVKLAFVADKLQENVKEGCVRINLASFSRDDLNAALEYLKERCNTPDPASPPPEVTTTGVGCHQFSDQISSKLHIKPQIITEMICFAKCFHHLTKYIPLEEITHPTPPKAIEYLKKFTGQWDEMVQKIQDHDFDIGQEIPDTMSFNQALPKQVLPSFICMLGSGAAYFKVEEDGKHFVLEGNTRCGRMFFGLGRLLTKAKSFDELVSLAATGDSSQVDITGRDVKTGKEGDIYGCISDDMILYCFGKATHEENFRREDLARSLLSALAQDLVHNITLSSQLHGLKHVFVCGSFADSHEVIREEISKHFLVKAQLFNMSKKEVTLTFLKHGGYLGAIGALLIDMLK